MDRSFTSSTYDDYATVYDKIKGDRSSDARLVTELIKKYRTRAKTVLELGCGTGGVLEGLAKQYQTTGLDISPAMLRIAKQKVPQATFYVADMSDFHLGQKFDAIYCVHSTLHHLPSFDDWMLTFDCAATQLKRGGIFIFDINTVTSMEELAVGKLSLYPAQDDFIIRKVTRHPAQKGRYNLEIRIFIQQDSYSFSYRPTTFEISTYSHKDIVQGVSKRFTVLDTFVLGRGSSVEAIDRMYFVCRKS
jgi:predicted TPR repeat methyltransferase